MDEAHGAWAFARDNAWILDGWLWAPAESAWAGFFYGSVQSQHRSGFFKLLLIKFFLGLAHKLTFEILDSEFDSTQFDDIELFDFVILRLCKYIGVTYLFAVLGLEWSNHQPKSVDAVFFN